MPVQLRQVLRPWNNAGIPKHTNPSLKKSSNAGTHCRFLAILNVLCFSSLFLSHASSVSCHCCIPLPSHSFLSPPSTVDRQIIRLRNLPFRPPKQRRKRVEFRPMSSLLWVFVSQRQPAPIYHPLSLSLSLWSFVLADLRL